MKIGMYETVPNFGDVLNNYLWQPYLGKFIGRDDNILMMGIGTLLGFSKDHSGQIIICGSGSGYGDDFSQILSSKTAEDFKVFFVRGPLTAKLLGLSDDMFITDPAILTPEIFPAAPATGKTVFVPHWETSLNPLWKTACDLAGVQYVDPLSDINDIMATISGAKLVIAEAMHAAIIADSYRVPWVSVSTSQRINAFKWQDWAGSLSMEHEFQYYAPLGVSAQVQNLSIGRAKMFETPDVDGFETEYTQAQPQQTRPYGGGMVALAKSVYKKIMPQDWQGGKDAEFLGHAASHVDEAINSVLKTGVYNKFFDHTIADIMKSANAEGHLSRDDIFNSKKLMLQEKLKEVHTYLENYPSR